MMPRLINDKFVSFYDWILLESFNFKEINFGFDFINGNFIQKGNGIVTFFKFENIFVCFIYNEDSGEFGYGTSNNKTTDLTEYDDKLGNTSVKSLLKLFNCLMFVMKELIKQRNINYFYIKNSNTFKLMELYSNMFLSPSFKSLLDYLNFEYKPTKDKFIFERK